MNFKKRVLVFFATLVFLLTFCYVYYESTLLPGPTGVEGWSQNTSKNASDYVRENLEPLIMPKNFCSEKGILLVIINIRPDNFEARSAIRETWAKKNDNVSFYFLVGEDKNKSLEVELKLEMENRNYNDIIQERFVDSYNNLTLKSVSMLKLFHLHCSQSYKYLMKIDDDIFLNVDNVLEMLRNRGSDTNLLVGKLINGTEPYRDPSNKWYVPYELYPDKMYPDYLCGPTYLMSTDVVEKLYRCALQTPLFFIEDVYITGICARKVNVKPLHDPMFTCNTVKKHFCVHKHLYTVHYYKPDEIRQSYRIWKEQTCPEGGTVWDWILRLKVAIFY